MRACVFAGDRLLCQGRRAAHTWRRIGESSWENEPAAAIIDGQ